MHRLNDREQRYAVIGAWLGGAVSVALWAPSFNETAGVVLAGIGLVMAALLYLAAQRRHRLFTGLACILLAFGPWGMAWVVGLPYLGLAGWLALKSPRLQPRMDPPVDDKGDIVDMAAEPVATSARRRGGWRRSRSNGGGDASPPTSALRKPPPASKRYTPRQPRS